MHPLLNTAVEAARAAGDIAIRNMNRLDRLRAEKKSHNEYVTEVDRAAEQAIIELIRRRYPEHSILAEESGSQKGNDTLWIIDPLDGTTNYMHGMPVFAVSIAVQVEGRLEAGVVYDPTRQELFTAVRGQGAQLDGRKIRVSHQKGLEGALIGTGFPYRSGAKYMKNYLAMFEEIMQQVAGVRRPGAAALDLSYLAAGRLDGFWEFGLQPWDIAAGALIIQEAGGLIEATGNDKDFMQSGNLVAGTPRVFAPLKEIVDKHLD